MDTKKIIETTNVKLAEATEVCVGVNDQLDGFTDALRDTLDNLTFIPAQLAAWDMNDFAALPQQLKEIGLGDEAVVKLTELYYAHKNAARDAAAAAVSAGAEAISKALQSGTLDAFLGLIPSASAAQPGEVDAEEGMPLEEFLAKLEQRASEGDVVAQQLLRRYSESVAPTEETVKEEVSEDHGER